MSRTKRVDPTKVGKPQTRHAIRSGYESTPSLHDRRIYEQRDEHYRQGKLWYQQGKKDAAEGVTNDAVPAEYRKHYDTGRAAATRE